MKYQVEIRRVVSYTIFVEVNASDSIGASEKALTEIKTKPIAFSKTGDYIVENETVQEIKPLE